MGRPVINEFQTDGYARGSDLIINDSNILSEIEGNVENKINVKPYHNISMVSVDWEKGTVGSFVIGTEYTAYRNPFITKATLLEIQVIGYGNGSTSTAQFVDSDASSSGTNNRVILNVNKYSPSGVAQPFTYNSATAYVLSQELTKSGFIYKIGAITGADAASVSGPLNLEFGPDDFIDAKLSIKAGSHASFDPFMSLKFIFKEEHSI